MLQAYGDIIQIQLVKFTLKTFQAEAFGVGTGAMSALTPLMWICNT